MAKNEKIKAKKEKKEKPEKIEKTVMPKAEQPTSFADEMKRLNRVSGQVEGLKKMLESGRKLSEVLVQFKAVHSALHSIEGRVLNLHLEKQLLELDKSDKRKDRSAVLSELEMLFRHAS